ncbi:MAG TPA: cytochrome P450 [Solirubrobacterales bacterium]|nr:cytochrome P450 [Solirubrobacterales bacterium]
MRLLGASETVGGPVADTALPRESVGELVRPPAPSPAGPIANEELERLPPPPQVGLPAAAQVLWFSLRQFGFVFRQRARLGDIWSARGYVRGGPVVVCHPDHVRSLFSAAPELVPTLAAESPLRPVLGKNSVLTANEPRHLPRRKLLLPAFHGEAIAAYERMIAAAAEREIARWPLGRPFSLAPRMQAITLDVILGGIFGIERRPRRGTPEQALRLAIREMLWKSTLSIARLAELGNLGRTEPRGLMRLGLLIPDRCVYAVIRKRRRADDLGERNDILSLLLRAEGEEGRPLSDRELRDELMTLVLAGHETTANQLAWAWERLLRAPPAHARLREAAREGDEAEAGAWVEATIDEAMRSRPVVPMTGRRVAVPWQFGPYGIPAGRPVAISILLLHHREDVYPDPFAFRPERWLGRKPGTFEWIPFGGGTRRCLGAALAMAEMRIVLREMARRLDLEADRPDPERPQHRNVTMIPARGGRVVLRRRRG